MREMKSVHKYSLALISLLLLWLWVSPLVSIWQKPYDLYGVPLFYLGIFGSWLLAIAGICYINCRKPKRK